MKKVAPKKPEVSVEDLSIVMLGDFNPKIFHPTWFAKEGLLRESEADDAKIEVVHQDVAAFSTGWLTVQVLRDRFTASVKVDAYGSHLSDLVGGTFEKLRHTPVRQMGMNVVRRVRFKTEEDWHAFGHLILPKSPWDGVISNPGLRAAYMQGERSDDRAGYVLIIIEPDFKTTSDVLVRVNDHYELGQSDQGLQSADSVVAIIERSHKESIARASAIVERLIMNFLNNEAPDKGK